MYPAATPHMKLSKKQARFVLWGVLSKVTILLQGIL